MKEGTRAVASDRHTWSVLVEADTASTYCYLLCQETQPASATWASHRGAFSNTGSIRMPSSPLDDFFAYAPSFQGGVFVGGG